MSSTKHIDRQSASDEKPIARVNSTHDGETLGAALFIGQSDLEELGFHDAEKIRYCVNNGQLQLEEVSKGER